MTKLCVGLFPHCCGAKLVYGFPCGNTRASLKWMQEQVDNGGYNGYTQSIVDSYIDRNKTIQNVLREDMQKFFDQGFNAFSMGTSENYQYTVNKKDRRAEGSSPLDKNSWVFAIVNNEQEYVCRPVLEEFGFKCIEEAKNPNSGNMIYLFLLKPNW